MVKRYVSKPVEIEAVYADDNFFGELTSSHNEFYEKLRDVTYINMDTSKVYIETLEGSMLINEGDYVIRGTQGEFYPCKVNIFREKYCEVK